MLTCTFASAQNIIGYLELAGRAKKDGRDLSGAKVSLYKEGRFEKEIITGRNGKFKFFIDYGYDYKITFNYDQCIEMHLLIFAKIPKEFYHIMPYYELGNIPFFEKNNGNIKLEKYKEPFTKIIFDGEKLFIDDEPYLDDFVKDIYRDPLEEAMAEAQKIGKKKAEERAKREAEERAREEARIREELKKIEEEEAQQRAEELLRLKEEEEKLEELSAQSKPLLTEADIQLTRQKETEKRIKQENEVIKSDYENKLLTIVAQSKSLSSGEAKEVMSKVSGLSMVERIKNEAEVKAKAEYHREQKQLNNKQLLVNNQMKLAKERSLLEAAYFAERTVKISSQTKLPNNKDYKIKPFCNIAKSQSEDWYKTELVTVVTLRTKIIVYKHQTYFWSVDYFYKNDKLISAEEYNNDIALFSTFINIE